MTGLRDYIAAVKRELKVDEMKEHGDITINRVHVVYLLSEVERLEDERDRLKEERAQSVLMIQSFIEGIDTELHLADQIKALGKML